jgi:RNA polymerase primary sigma factor
MNDSLVTNVFEALAADYERNEGLLTREDVERLLEKRGLTVEECARVYEKLSAADILVGDINSADDFAPPDNELDNPIEASAFLDFVTSASSQLKHKLLSKEDEAELGRSLELGRRAKEEIDSGVQPTSEHLQMIERASRARERFILTNLRLVASIARPYTLLSDLSLEDLFQEGVFGLMKAVDKFDHHLGYKFSTYATWWIRQTVTRALADRGTMIRLPVHVHEQVNKLRRAVRLLSMNNPERTPTIKEISKELNWPHEKVHFLQQMSFLVPTSLDAQIPGAEDMALIDTLISPFEGPEEYVERMSMESAVQNVLEQFPERDREILNLRFGLGGHLRSYTLQEVGDKMGLTRERVRQVESKLLRKIQNNIRHDEHHPLSGYKPDDDRR